jgi:hypothetical protein
MTKKQQWEAIHRAEAFSVNLGARQAADLVLKKSGQEFICGRDEAAKALRASAHQILHQAKDKLYMYLDRP